MIGFLTYLSWNCCTFLRSHFVANFLRNILTDLLGYWLADFHGYILAGFPFNLLAPFLRNVLNWIKEQASFINTNRFYLTNLVGDSVTNLSWLHNWHIFTDLTRNINTLLSGHIY